MVEQALAKWMESGRRRMGEVMITATADGYALTHYQDSAREDLKRFEQPEDAREIAKFDETGEFRPLKTAPTLRRGWKLVLPDVGALRLAMDFLYPAMCGIHRAHEEGRLNVVNFRETANRQTGMYEVVRTISDAQADKVIGGFCRSGGGCLKTILWKIDRERLVTTLPRAKFEPDTEQLPENAPSIPMLCAEPCHLLISAARAAIRKAAR